MTILEPPDGTGAWARAGLRIDSKSLSTEEITSLIPREKHREGINPADADVQENVSFCTYESNLGANQPVEDHIADMLQLLEDADPKFADLVTNGTINLRLTCAFKVNRSLPMTFSTELIDRLGRLPLTLWMTAYAL